VTYDTFGKYVDILTCFKFISCYKLKVVYSFTNFYFYAAEISLFQLMSDD